ncbi:hypothetical protein, partial [Cereibacter sphaeroides]|uniref:hypothetical protein n=1 Tax=Cereibacter sphaeroides TaxID=1063 RepID=UPI00313F093A
QQDRRLIGADLVDVGNDANNDVVSRTPDVCQTRKGDPNRVVTIKILIRRLLTQTAGMVARLRAWSSRLRTLPSPGSGRPAPRPRHA